MSEKKGAPAWMVSFGDMMTLILTFFILMVSLSKTQQVGLIAQGVGSFLLAVRSFGLPGALNDYDKAAAFEHVRRRFLLPPEEDPDKRPDEHVDASQLEVIRAMAADALRPHNQISQPAIAVFPTDSALLDESARRYLDLLAPLLHPGPGQLLLLEGHSLDAGQNYNGDHHLLAAERANAVRDYFMDAHDFPGLRVEARVWLSEIAPAGPATRSVDARLIIPTRDN